MNPQSTKRLVLIDAHAILHRAYHALPAFSNSAGEPTGGLYGLASMLIKIIGDLRPDYLAAAYDLPKPTFRHEAYKEYKAGRAKADDALISQMKRSREIFEAFGIPIYDKEGFEADDILGTIVEITKHQETITKKKKDDKPLDSRLRGNDRHIEIIIASGDMDTLQLVDDKHVQVFTLKKGINDTVLYDEEKVKERFGFGPELLPDYKGLCGDASDNIKGIAGIGDKTATELVRQFGPVEEIYKTIKKNKKALEKKGVKPRVVELLEKGKEDAEFSKILATIRRDAPIAFSLPEKPWRESVDVSKAETLFRTLEFRTLGERLKDAISSLKEEMPTCLRADTHGQNLRGRGVTDGAEKTPSLSPALKAGEEKRVTAQASLTDALPASGIAPREFRQTSVALWLINSNLTNPTLDDILGFARLRDTRGQAQVGDFDKARDIVFAEIKKRNLTRVFEEIEQPLIPLVERMNERGVRIDSSFLKKLSKDYHQELSLREKEIWKQAGKEFNVNSPKQLGEVLFVTLGLKPARQKKTATGALSTRESELLKLRDAHPIIGKILEYREFQKLLTTYIDNIPQMVAKDGRLHANFLQAGATTGRMASEHPNLQNIPIQTELGRRIRNAFVAEHGFTLLSFDYSQIELRVAAILSGDRKLIEIFKAGIDVHAAVAAEVFKVPRGKVTKEMRRQAKVINFGILYGMGVNSLRQTFQEGGSAVSRADAQHFYDEYFADFYELAGYLNEVKVRAYKEGYTETLFGRRRYFAAIRSPIPYIRAAAERQAVNAPIQGTATADIIKLAMVKVDEYVRREKLDDQVFLILQVHDELVYEVKEGLVKELAPKIKKIMESVVSPKDTKGVPIVVEARKGKNWDEMKEV